MTAPEAAELEAVDAALAGRRVDPDHAELAELALLLRDERPEPAPAWAAQLDRRVEARFPARPRKRRNWQWVRHAAPVLAVLALLSPIALIASLPSGTDDDGGGGGEAATGVERSADSGGAGAEVASGGLSDQAAPDVVETLPKAGDPNSDARGRRNVQRSAELTLAAPRRSLDRVASRIPGVAADLGGFVASSSVSSAGGGDFRLRVPTGQLDTAIERLSRLGRVRNVSRNSLDITSTVVSARARLTDARTERESLLRQLAAADTVNETESIRARLDIVSREIAAARNSLRKVRNRANFANLSVTLVPASGDSDEGAWTPGDAFDDALRVLEVAAGVAVIALAIVLPLLAVWLLAWLAHRAVVRRRRERSLDLA
jgi:Domain of unknown function (DUF4349)